MSTTERLRADLHSYFHLGGTFNPEMMDPYKVQKLLERCRDYFVGRANLDDEIVKLQEQQRKCHGTLRECELEILRLRRSNELLSAKVEVMDLFAQVLHTKPAERSCPASPDVVFQIVKRLEGL